MKIKTLAIIGLLALAPTHSTELSAASNTTVRVARDGNGKVDYKNFYQNGSRVKYENWDNGKKTVVINYKNSKVNSKTYYSNGVKTKYEKWSSGRVIQRTTYKNSKVTSKTYYSNGIKTKYEKWSSGRVVQRAIYKARKVTSKIYYTNGTKTEFQRWSNGKITNSYFYRNGRCTEKKVYVNGKLKNKTYYDKNGNLISRYVYGGYSSAADVTYWYPSGQVEATEIWERYGYQVVKRYNQQGDLVRKDIFNFNTKIAYTTIYEGGKVVETTSSTLTGNV